MTTIEPPAAAPICATIGERWAGVSIGSDTIHLLVADLIEQDGQPAVRRVVQQAQLLTLGMDVARYGEVRGKTQSRLTATLQRYVAAARKRTGNLVIGATEATRRAKNGEAVLASLADTVGIPIRQLSGEREAHLGFVACRPWLDAAAVQILIDSGGASTEVTAARGGDVVGAVSLPVGASLLAASFHDDPPHALPWALLASRIGTALAALPAVQPTMAWATGGSAHNLVGLERRSGPGAAIQTLTMADLDGLSAELLRHPARRIARASGESALRVKLLPPGALILGAILQHYGLDACGIVPVGVREGMLLAVLQSGDDWWRDDAPAQRDV